MLRSSPKMITAVLNSEISKKFSEWEQSFYNHLQIATADAIFESYQRHDSDDEQKFANRACVE